MVSINTFNILARLPVFLAPRAGFSFQNQCISMFPSNWSDSQFYIAMLKAGYWGSDWWIETDKSLFSFSRAYTVLHTNTHHSSRPTGLSALLLVMDVCYLEHPSDASRSTDLSVSDLAGHRIYGLHLVMVCWWSCVYVWERERESLCVSTHLIRRIHLEPAGAHVIKIWSDASGNPHRDPAHLRPCF